MKRLILLFHHGLRRSFPFDVASTTFGRNALKNVLCARTA